VEAVLQVQIFPEVSSARHDFLGFLILKAALSVSAATKSSMCLNMNFPDCGSTVSAQSASA